MEAGIAADEVQVLESNKKEPLVTCLKALGRKIGEVRIVE